MNTRTQVGSRTVRAYRLARYRVGGVQPSFVLHPGKVSAALATLYQAYGVDRAAFITAFNPYGERQTRWHNRRAHQSLEDDLNRRALVWLPGAGSDRLRRWPPESSCLVLGIAQAAADAIATRFHQNAILWAGADARPQLRLLR